MFQLNTESTPALVESVKNLPGKTFVGRHKNPGRPSRVVSLEVTAVAAIPTKFGIGAYLVGTLVDDPKNAGRVVSMKLLGFDLSGVEVVDADGFVPVDLSGYYVRGPEATDAMNHFNWLEKLEADEDKALAVAEGMKPLADYIVAGTLRTSKTKAARKAKKTTEEVAA